MPSTPQKIFLSLVLLFAVQTSALEAVTLSASKDCSIFEENPGNANGAGSYFHVGNNADGFSTRALLAFDIAAAIPAGSTITSVTLTMNMS